jgi:bifunctional enzyme CysN/CysC
MDDLRIVVAGHVDHGKSTLIGRLLYDTGSLPRVVSDRLAGAGAAFAFVTDQFAEEQEGSFTLDTAQARLRTARRDYTLIDTPGHREFLKNMVTGTTRADAAVLVVDVAEGPLPQTYLHAYLIAMLGIRQVIVALNKMDMVSYDRDRFERLAQHLACHLERIGITPLATIPVSAQQGDHVVRAGDRMPWDRAACLLEVLDGLVPVERRGEEPLRFLVQCPFRVDGRCVMLGKVLSGTLRRGQSLLFGPGHHETTVTSILVGRQEVPLAPAGQCVGIVLQDAGPVERGYVGFARDHAPVITDRLSARAFWIDPQPLDARARIEVLCGTQSRGGRVEAITRVIDPVSLEAVASQAARLDDSQVGEITIRTDAPLCVDPSDRGLELGRLAILQSARIAGGGILATD